MKRAPHQIIGEEIQRIIPKLSAEPTSGQASADSQLRWRIPSETVARHKDGATLPIESLIGTLATCGRRSYIAIVHDITEGKRYEEQLEYQANHDPDFRMPGMNGAEFLGRAKELYPETVRIMLSGHADFDSVTEAVNMGAIYKFLNKPWSDDDVRDKIGQAFRQYSLHQAA